MMIGDSPGKTEDKRGEPLCGLAGQEFNYTYLDLAGLRRSEIFCTNTVQCRVERNESDVRPTAGIIESCASNHLIEEIHTVNPKIIILSGAVANSLVPGINLEMEHGFPRPGELFGWTGTIVPMYSPAVGMHETRYMIQLLEDWTNFGRWLSGQWKPPVPPSIPIRYTLIPPGGFWEAVGAEPEYYSALPIDTESDEGRMWSVQFSTQPGVGFMFLTSDRSNVEDFGAWLAFTYDNRVIMHNAPWDLDELFQIGISDLIAEDTMQDSYHIGNKPQGLKALTYRLFGHRMVSYRETVIPYSKSKLEGWLAEALGYASTELRSVVPHPVGKSCPTCGKNHRKDVSVSKPHESESTLRRIMEKMGDPESEYDPWEMPKYSKGVEKTRLIGKPWMKELEAAVGRMPRCSIVHVPIEQAVQYGCSDADWTGRVGEWFAAERKRIVRAEWRVA